MASSKSFNPRNLQLVMTHWSEPWLTHKELALRFGLSDPTVSLIINSPEGQEIIRSLTERSLDTMLDVQAQLQAIAPMALKERIEIAFDRANPVSVRDRALGAIIEMAGHAPPKRVQIERPQPGSDINSLTDAEITDSLLDIVSKGKGPDGKLVN